MRLFRICLLTPVLLTTTHALRAQTMPMSMPMDMPMPPATSAALPTAADVKVALSTAVEDGKKQLVATVTRNGKPVENATVSFRVKRTFGQLVLGSDVTLDDGTAAIAFPSDLPGGLNGELEISAMVQGPLSQWGASDEATIPGGKPKPAQIEDFPAALWAPSAPVGLIAVIAVLVGGAWGSYLFVAIQLVAIRKGALK